MAWLAVRRGERAAFLLREVFDYDYPEAARIVGVRVNKLPLVVWGGSGCSVSRDVTSSTG